MQQTLSRLPTFEIKKKKLTSSLKIVLACSLFYFGLFISFYFNPINIVLFSFCLAIVLFSNEGELFCFLLFIFPFATVFKIGDIETSLFTLVELISVVKLFLRRKSLDIVYALLITFFSLTCFISLITFGGVIEIVKVLMAFLLVYYFSKLNEKETPKRFFYFYVASIILSTLMGLFRGYIPGLAHYVPVGRETWIGETGSTLHSTLRFSGLNKDPNYYSLYILPSIAILFSSCFTLKGRKKLASFFLFLLISLFGVLTLSKSFILLYSVIILFLLFSHLRKHFSGVIFVSLCLTIVVVINPFGIFSDIFLRLGSFAGITDLNSFTTGRINIWEQYFKEIGSSSHFIVFGHGIDAGYLRGMAAHNLYIEGIYKTGIIGLILFCMSYFYIFAKGIKRFHSLRDFSPLLICIVMYFFLAGFAGYELPFYLIIAYASLNHGLDKLV